MMRVAYVQAAEGGEGKGREREGKGVTGWGYCGSINSHSANLLIATWEVPNLELHEVVVGDVLYV
jgi:hypothetical protein